MRRSPTILTALVTALLVSCTAVAPAALPTPTQQRTALRVGLGYIPSVQFAQFYLAEQRGYYREAGLDVTFENKIDPDLVTLVGQGTLDFGIADGTSVIPAVSQGIPVRYIATIYARFPNVVFARASSGIRSVADLEGVRLGIPGRYGSSWIMLQALLASEGLTPEDLEIVEYPDFGQLAGLRQGAVEAATGFANNEPVQLELAGEEVTVLRVDQITPLPGPGLIIGPTTTPAHRPFVALTLRAMQEIIDNPEAGLEAAITRVPELGSDRETQLRILEATIETWQSPYTQANGLGAIDQVAWERSIEFLDSLPDDPVNGTLEVSDVVTEDLLP